MIPTPSSHFQSDSFQLSAHVLNAVPPLVSNKILQGWYVTREFSDVNRISAGELKFDSDVTFPLVVIPLLIGSGNRGEGDYRENYAGVHCLTEPRTPDCLASVGAMT